MGAKTVCFDKAKAQAEKSLTHMMKTSEWTPVKIVYSPECSESIQLKHMAHSSLLGGSNDLSHD